MEPTRFMGRVSPHFWMACSGVNPTEPAMRKAIWRMRSVSNGPGRILFTVTPVAATSRARVPRAPNKAGLSALVKMGPGVVSLAEVELMLMTRPKPCSIMPGTQRRTRSKAD